MGPTKSYELKGDSSYRDSSYREFTVPPNEYPALLLTNQVAIKIVGRFEYVIGKAKTR